MFSVLQKLFGQGSAAQDKSSLSGLEDEDIPRYPPFAKGLPVASVQKVLDTQRELIDRIRGTLGFTKDDFGRLVEPVLYRYATMVHLLPASEAHHHRGAGGLLRHGLEVAFWAAQASEAVIFSIEGTPLERRNNEPRWRLASCFAGLLHDVGKPLSDVSVTNKDGSKSWNPYSESLVDWADRHKIDRYFIRWRGKRHKRHEQFSLLTLERVLTQQALEYLSEPGPEIVEAMLEAIAGTGVNQPITKLMLRADQESVSRDLRQSRLSADEFSYGVPVERYVFDAIRRLIKSGQWKVNEPGAKVWHLHQGVFIAWKQGISQLYELIEKDKIPGIPRDPDTLADILIERGFVVPNRVEEKGEGAYYRYWEVQPKPLQEGAVAANVKLLMLRLDSADLVFTTEPPAPVDGDIAGEAEESALYFDAPENVLAEAEQNEASLLESHMPTQPSESNEGSATDKAAPATETDTTAEEAPSPKEIAESAAPLSPDNPLQALAAATGNIDGLEFPFDAFGVKPNDSSSEQRIESVAAIPLKEQKALAAEQHKEVALPATEKREPSSSATAQSSPGDGASKGSAESSEADEIQPGTPRQGARQALAEVIEAMGEAKPLLEKAVNPVLEGRQTLGEVLYLAEGRVVLLYPEGARALGAPTEVLSTLFDAGAIVPDPIMPGRKVCDFNGIKALMFSDELSTAMVAAIREIEDSLDPYQDMLALVKKTQPKKERKKSASNANRREKAKRKQEAKGKRAAQTQGTGPTNAVSSEQQLETGEVTRKKVARGKAHKPSPEATATELEKQNIGRLPERSMMRQEEARPSQKASEPRAAKPTPPHKEAGLLERRPDAKPVAEELFLPPKMTPEEAVRLLKDMMLKRSGRWLVTPVLEEDGSLRTSDKALEKVAGEFAGLLSKTALKTQIAVDRSKPTLQIRQGQLILKVK